MQEVKTYWLGKKDFSYNPLMADPSPNTDPVRSLILQRAAETGQKLGPLSKKMGRNHAYLQQFVNRGIPERLDEEDRQKLAELLDVDEIELRGPGSARTSRLTTHTPRPAANARMGPSVDLDTCVVPLFGQGAAGKDGSFPFNGEQVGEIPAPPWLARTRGAYAVYVVGTSMVPRYQEGEVVLVDPTKPLLRGKGVVLQVASKEGDPPEGFIKEYVSRDARSLHVRQLNPKKLIHFRLDKVIKAHRIVMGGDG